MKSYNNLLADAKERDHAAAETSFAEYEPELRKLEQSKTKENRENGQLKRKSSIEVPPAINNYAMNHGLHDFVNIFESTRLAMQDWNQESDAVQAVFHRK